MSQKTKRLAKVIVARERMRDRQAADAATAERVLEDARNAQADLQLRESMFNDSLSRLTRAPISSNLLIDLDRQRRMWTQCVDAAADQVAEHSAEAERRRVRLREAAMSLRISERVHDRITTLEQRERDKREQRASDDLTASRRPR